MNPQVTTLGRSQSAAVSATNKVVKNTYMLLAMTLAFSAATAGAAMALNLPHPGPILNAYLAMPNGSQVVMMAMGGTAAIFLALSAYVMTTRKDFSFMGGFLMVGILVAFLAGLGAIFFHMPGLSLAVSAMFVLLMSGLILYETSNIIHGGETNYIMATVTLFVAIFNLFTSLLSLLGFANND